MGLEVLERDRNSPQGMLKPVVTTSRINIVGPPKLLDGPESLELRCVDDEDHQRMHLYRSVDGVTEHLATVYVLPWQQGTKIFTDTNLPYNRILQ